VFRRECTARGLNFSEEGVRQMLERWWVGGRPLRMCQPRDLVEQVVAIARYKGVPLDLSDIQLLDQACASYFAVTLPD
jgi:hypothetical protein